MTREDIFGALFALTSSLAWGSPPRSLAYSARRVKLWDEIGRAHV